MKVKCAFGDFHGALGSYQGVKYVNKPTTSSSTHSAIIAVERKCNVLGVNVFNIDANEKDFRLYDVNTREATRIVENSTNDEGDPWDSITEGETVYAAIKTTPLIYQTIVPKDTSLSAQPFKLDFDQNEFDTLPWTYLNGREFFSTTFGMDFYDTPSGIYETFPSPGFLFENGITIDLATGAPATTNPASAVFYQIFYVES